MDRVKPATPPVLPDCPSCHADESLEADRADFKGSIWAHCTVCLNTYIVKDGVIVYQGEPKTDVRGVVMDGP